MPTTFFGMLALATKILTLSLDLWGWVLRERACRENTKVGEVSCLWRIDLLIKSWPTWSRTNSHTPQLLFLWYQAIPLTLLLCAAAADPILSRRVIIILLYGARGGLHFTQSRSAHTQRLKGMWFGFISTTRTHSRICAETSRASCIFEEKGTQ